MMNEVSSLLNSHMAKKIIWLYRKRKLSNVGFEDNPIRGRVKLAHESDHLQSLFQYLTWSFHITTKNYFFSRIE